MKKLLEIDDSDRSHHCYLTPDDKCYYLHEYTARKGYAYSPGNRFILNFKKPTTKKDKPEEYRYKQEAIDCAISTYCSIFNQHPDIYKRATFVPIPPSKTSDHPEYDDRMWRVVQGVCRGTEGDARELIRQIESYHPAHCADDGGARIKPEDLQRLYQIVGNRPRPILLLFDDVLVTGCHFRAAKSVILEAYPDLRVVGLFLARRVPIDPVNEFETAR